MNRRTDRAIRLHSDMTKSKEKIIKERPPRSLVSLQKPDDLSREFLRTVFLSLFRGRYLLRGSHMPGQDYPVPLNFMGVGVAPPESPAMDGPLIEHLREMGVGCLRLDYTESNRDDADRLLKKLVKEDLGVLLHCVQPLEEARKMPDATVAEGWRRFVFEAMQQWGGQIEAVEFGSTINRIRWAGYTIDGFVKAWEIGFQQARKRGVKVVGPNVTDFEPQYNVGVLSILKKRGLLPDIHSNNLFSERCIEPEAYDHKILGHRLKGWIKYNLIKKARLIEKIGLTNGINQTWSGNGFWTLPRIERILINPEEKQADYLTRYLILCAASGSFQRLYWGPFISRREGLVDDGSTAEIALDRVTLYDHTLGNPVEWKRRPAFYALKTFTRLIPGSMYLGAPIPGPPLQIYEFLTNGRRIHVVWTMNAHSAHFRECYEVDDLKAAEYLKHTGQKMTFIPDVITESPLYLVWPSERKVSVLPGAAVSKGVSIFTNTERARYYSFQDAKWRGLVLANSRAEADRLIKGLHPEQINQLKKHVVLRTSRNMIWTVVDPRNPGSEVVVKQPLRIVWYKRLLDRIKPSKAVRSWSGACQLMRRGIPTPKPIAFFENAEGYDPTQNWYVCEYIPSQLSARSFFSAYASGEDQVEGYTLSEFLDQICPFIYRMHRKGVFFRDLSGGNVVVEKGEDHALRFFLIDTARARFSNQPFTVRDRIADLKRLSYKLHPAGQKQFMETYLGRESRQFLLRHRIGFKFYDLKARIKRFKRKMRKMRKRIFV